MKAWYAPIYLISYTVFPQIEPKRTRTKKGTNQKEHELKRAQTKKSTNLKGHEPKTAQPKRARTKKGTNQKEHEPFDVSFLMGDFWIVFEKSLPLCGKKAESL